MENGKVDLHLHTNASDGTFSPQELVDKALEMGLGVISITDHDTVNGVEKAFRYINDRLKGEESLNNQAKLPLEIIPGIELSSTFRQKDVHFLGYFIDYKNKKLVDKLDELRSFRIERGWKITEKLANAGITIDFQEILKKVGEGTISRLHLAKALVEGKYVYSIEYAMKKYLLKGKVGYVPHNYLSAKKCIRMIKEAGGIVVLAHPGLYDHDEFIFQFVKDGIDGIEVYHTSHSFEDTNKYIKIASKYNLLITGGSDCHGLVKGNPMMGIINIPYRIVEDLKRKHRETISTGT